MKSTTEQRHRAENLTLLLAEAQEKYKAVDREAGQLRTELAILEAKVRFCSSWRQFLSPLGHLVCFTSAITDRFSLRD